MGTKDPSTIMLFDPYEQKRYAFVSSRADSRSMPRTRTTPGHAPCCLEGKDQRKAYRLPGRTTCRAVSGLRQPAPIRRGFWAIATWLARYRMIDESATPGEEQKRTRDERPRGEEDNRRVHQNAATRDWGDTLQAQALEDSLACWFPSGLPAEYARPTASVNQEARSRDSTKQ